MFLKRLLFLGLALCLHATTASAQFAFYHFFSFDVIRPQPLVVLLQEENPKELRKLADKPQELADYKAYIAYYNKQIQLLAPQYWKFSPSVEFRPESALKEIRAAKGKRTVVLRYETHTNGASTGGYNSVFMGSRKVASMELTTPGSGDQNLEWSCPAPLDLMYPSDIIFALKNIQLMLEKDLKRKTRYDAGVPRRDIEQQERADALVANQADAALIRTRTLLIAEADLSPKLTAEDIKQLYPYPFQVVPRATIEAAVQAADTRYTYVRRMSQSVEVIGPYLIDAATSRTLAIANTSGVGGSKHELLNKDDFKIFTAYVRKHEQ
ncbi:MAG TPA: hypothetical protein VFO93_14640 [Hymenobacter sp.]|uniref:hypothetical protein n=1 Tax=Hymenobacter sp. TaxID=1898978 RepID=UPI002D8105EC|nr:hypothetical protein [Hymenobacter sp.]HET9504778.1 hypothetical protein [Hymenobacter sp.]